jgi:hypothetical protein
MSQSAISSLRSQFVGVILGAFVGADFYVLTLLASVSCHAGE